MKRTIRTALIILSCAAISFAVTSAQAGPFFTGLGDLPGGEVSSVARAVSADGSTVVGRGTSASGEEAFRWTLSGGMVGLGDLPGGGFLSNARSVSADGSAVVGSGTSASGLEAFRWTLSGGMVGLGDAHRQVAAERELRD